MGTTNRPRAAISCGSLEHEQERVLLPAGTVLPSG